jgi:hypothetical protein
MKPRVGQAVKRSGKPHGVITEIGEPSVTVAWHLKEATNLGPGGMATGTVYEDPAVLIPDNTCPHCNRFLVLVK